LQDFLERPVFYLRPEFYDFVAICYAVGKTILLARSIFNKDYSLKEQTWLATYAVRRRTERQFSPPLSFRLATLFLKGRHTPAFSLTPCTIYHPAMTGKAKAGNLTARLGLI